MHIVMHGKAHTLTTNMHTHFHTNTYTCMHLSQCYGLVLMLVISFRRSTYMVAIYSPVCCSFLSVFLLVFVFFWLHSSSHSAFLHLALHPLQNTDDGSLWNSRINTGMSVVWPPQPLTDGKYELFKVYEYWIIRNYFYVFQKAVSHVSTHNTLLYDRIQQALCSKEKTAHSEHRIKGNQQDVFR